MTDEDDEKAEAEAEPSSEDLARLPRERASGGGLSGEPMSGPAGPDEDGWPAFAARFPAHDGLRGLTEAFARGDYRTVREGTARIIADETEDRDVRGAARLLRARTEPDPTARVFFVLAAALLAFLSIYWLTHDGPEHVTPPAGTSFPQVEHVK